MNSNIVKVTVKEDVRVRTAEGDAYFLFPRSPRTVDELGNDLPARWITIPKGSNLTLCAKFEKTDTFLCALEVMPTPTSSRILGVVLRRMSWEKILAASDHAVAQIEQHVEAIEEAAGELPAEVATVVEPEPVVANGSSTPAAPERQQRPGRHGRNR